MTGIIPDTVRGGKVIRDAAGIAKNPPNTPNAYSPPATFTSTAPLTAYGTDCRARWSPEQMNAIVSELMCLAATMTPNGRWDLNSACNLATAWVATGGTPGTGPLPTAVASADGSATVTSTGTPLAPAYDIAVPVEVLITAGLPVATATSPEIVVDSASGIAYYRSNPALGVYSYVQIAGASATTVASADASVTVTATGSAYDLSVRPEVTLVMAVPAATATSPELIVDLTTGIGYYRDNPAVGVYVYTQLTGSASTDNHVTAAAYTPATGDLTLTRVTGSVSTTLPSHTTGAVIPPAAAGLVGSTHYDPATSTLFSLTNTGAGNAWIDVSGATSTFSISQAVVI